MMKLEGCTALITGASAGIGAEFARQLAPRASALVLVARRSDRLEQLRDELTEQKRDFKIFIRAADLSEIQHVDELCVWLHEQGLNVDFLINNAGSGDRGLFATSDPQRVTEMMQVNVIALTLLTRRLLPPMLERKRGAILNVSSCASFLPIPEMGVYAATKAYVTSFSEALRMEARGSGISVTALCPGPVHTEFDAVAMRKEEPKEAAPEFTYVAVQEVVRAGLCAVQNDRALSVPGLVMKLAMLLVRLTPMVVLRMAGRLRP